MFLPGIEIDGSTLVNEIVALDYRTADVFRKYGIDFCCGGKVPLRNVCELRGLEIDEILLELRETTRNIQTSRLLPFAEWNLDFLVDYIINVHHSYIYKALPVLIEYVNLFLAGHKNKYPGLTELQRIFTRIDRELRSHLSQEEEIIFPYIKQISNAYRRKETYASLLVRTLRKPVKDIMIHEHDVLMKLIMRTREITDYYRLPEKSCALHKVTFGKLREFDNDLTQHIYLENSVLFPRSIQMEMELLEAGA
jgi:regulator of cell morphogenesis and NO signaling